MTLLRRACFGFLRFAFGGVRAARFLGVTVGEGCRVYTRDCGTEPWLVSIGSRVTVTSVVQFVTHDGSTWLLRDGQGRRYRYAPVVVGSDVFIGLNTIVLPGVRIGDRVIVGAASVLTKSVPPGTIVAGNPARIIGTFDQYRGRALAGFPTASMMRGESYRERILSVLDAAPRPELSAK
jgi:acetyltransferase-like isoleucine patch superfamily enzyme